jgi:FKBP-type peptidyl-prolyl cis-trans isomerase (trigger factor)
LKLKKQKYEKALTEISEMRVKEVISDQAIKENDKALIDIQMFLDNVPLEGGQSQDAAIIIGKNYIIPALIKFNRP